jgi:predicted aldo/keto reductase-like oxidoreductase
MIYRTYGKTDKKVSVLGFGAMRFANIDDRDECVEMMLEAAQGGVNYFDSAFGYFGGKSEEVLGEGFAEFRRRNIPYYCSTKTFKSEEKEIRDQLETQLKRLKLDAVDFYHIWCITSPANWQERKKNGVIETLRKLKEEGLIRHICVSSHLVGDEIKELLMEGVFEGVLFGYSAYNFNVRQAAFQAITRHELGCVVMNPLGGGLIPRNPGLFEFVKTQPDETVVEAALRFLFAHKEISTALVGFSNRDEVREALRAVEGYREIGKTDLERMKDSVSDSFRDLCTGCQYCDHCPEEIRVPKFMEAYNQKKLYGKNENLLNHLKWHYSVPVLEAEKCVDCGDCEELCTQHLPIIDRLKEIAEIGREAAAQAEQG